MVFLKMKLTCCQCVVLFAFVSGISENYELNLHPDHLPYYFSLFSDQLNCSEVNCFNQEQENRCWGYEQNCSYEKSFNKPLCPGDHPAWLKSKKKQLETFYSQADFGYVKNERDSFEIICTPTFLQDSVLECSQYLHFCRTRNILLNLTHLDDLGTWRYRMDVLKPGDIAGYCEIHHDRLERKSEHMSPLQSWAPELRNFRRLPQRLNIQNDCDVYIDKPTFILKIDAAVNMYHHLCDFFNLYASLHVNASHPAAFSTDVEIIIWETYAYRSAFSDLWEAFTDHPVKTLDTFAGKTVCFRNLVLPLLPRMIFGLYYNTPLVDGCEKSGLFKAFSQHVLHRLRIKNVSYNSSVIRVTFLSRETSYRNVINEDELLSDLSAEPKVQVQKIVFDKRVSFKKQLKIMRATDILISMHGAGLTHLLFLPDWAAVFELYNCEDENCYSDLARLRGIKYATWEKKDKLEMQGMAQHPDGGIHAKFADYVFDRAEFLRIFRKLASYVRAHGSETKIHDEL